MLVQPVENLLAMSELSFAQELKNPAEFAGEVTKVEVAPAEVKLAKTLTDAMAAKDFDITAYKDSYTDNLTALIEAKINGKEVMAPPAEEVPQVINLMEALQRSVEATRKAASAAGAKPPKLAAPGTAAKKEVAVGRKRKTS